MTCTRCGCPMSLHEHFHRGSYCGRCGPDICPAARAPRPRWLQLFRRRTRREWEIKVTSPEGMLLRLDTEQLYAVWKFGRRSNDGYVDILEMPRMHLWVKPAGWVEPDRAAELDGTAALPERYQRR